MSLKEKLEGLMQRPGQENDPKDDMPWWLKYGARVAGSVGGVFALGFGFFMCISFSPLCIISGIWQMIAGFAVLIIEAPCCCFCVQYVNTVSSMADSRPLWMRSAFYVGIALPALIFCFGFSALFGSGMIFVTGSLYGFMALGKKASAEEMRARADLEAGQNTKPDPPSTISNPSQLNSGMNASLVSNAQPMGTSFPGGNV